MLDKTISNKTIILVAIAHAIIGWSCMVLIGGILRLPFGLGFQALLTLSVSQIACVAILFCENRKPALVDFTMLFVAIAVLASGIAPGGALSIYVPTSMKASDQRIYLTWIGVAIWLGLIAVYSLILLVDRLVIALLGQAIRILLGKFVQKDKSTPETFSIANILLGTTMIAILLAVLANPQWDSWDLNVPRQMIVQVVLASLIPFFTTWGFWVAGTKPKKWWSLGFVQGLMFACWPLVAYHLVVDSWLIKSRGLPVLFADRFLSAFEKFQGVLLLIGICACTVQLTIVCVFVSNKRRNRGMMEQQMLLPTDSNANCLEKVL